MEEDIKFGMLYDIYGKLLTKKQQEIVEEYFLYNLSLREIAENKNISYQAVRDSITKSKLLLEEYENAIGMKNLQMNVNKVKDMCLGDKPLNKKLVLKTLENNK